MPRINAPDERDRHIPSVDFQDSETAEEVLHPGIHDEVKDVQENADGGATVVFDDDGEAEDPEFLANLAETLDSSYLTTLAGKMLDLFDQDEESRKKRDLQYAEGIRRTGVGNEAPGGATFEGASRAVHPVLIEGCIEFAARAMKELFPASGPVKTAIIGTATDEKLQKAERKKTFMNWQLTKQIREYRSELEQTLTQVPLGGSQFLKIWYDERVERPRVEFIPVDEMLLPFAASDFESAERKTHMQQLTPQVLKTRSESGLYREVDPLLGAGTGSDQTESAKASDKVEGKEEPSSDPSMPRTVYESYCELEIPEDTFSDGEQRGYILTIDKESRQVLALYRNWDENDKKKTPGTLDWIVEFGFVPWRGAYKIGLGHIIGGLSGALTGALRAVLDSAHLQNTPGGLMLKGARTSGKTVTGEPTQMTVLDAPPNVDDIRKLAMPYPFNGPSPVLVQVMMWLTEQARGVVSTASEAIKDAGSDMPVGTALALIEQGSITFSAIHGRLHASQRRVLEILHRIDGTYLADEETIEELGSLVVRRADFQGPMDVMPVSDPNIYSDSQRYAQNQAAIAMAEKFPQAFKTDKLVARAMRLINYPDFEEVLNAPKAPKYLDEIAENVEASEPDTQLKAYSDQDHLTHLKAHVQFMVSPLFCSNPLMAMPALPKLLAHCREHLMFLYKAHARAASAAAKALMGEDDKSASLQGLASADQVLAQDLEPIMPHFEQAQKAAMQFAPKPPGDPRTDAQLKIAADKLEYQKGKDASDAQAEVAKAQAAAAEKQGSDRLEAALAQMAQQTEMMKEQAESARSTQEMQVAARNADLASRSEAEDRRINLIIQHMTQDAEDARAAQAAQTQVTLALIKEGQAADRAEADKVFQAHQDRVQKQFDLLQSMLTQPNASASESADNQISGFSKFWRSLKK